MRREREEGYSRGNKRVMLWKTLRRWDKEAGEENINPKRVGVHGGESQVISVIEVL